MNVRIRELEDALAIVYASVSSERHPLLNEKALKIKFGPETLGCSSTPPISHQDYNEPSIDALGTLGTPN